MPVYAIYNPWAIPDSDSFIDSWNRWAKEEGFPGVYFVKNVGSHDRDVLGKYSAKVTREPNYTFAHDEKLLEKVFRVAKTRAVGLINKKFLIKNLHI